MKLTDAMETLSQAAQALQTATEELNAELVALDEWLTQIGAGVTAWLPEALFESEWLLGYTRVGGKMTIAVRQGERDPLALIHAPRHVRVASVARLPELVEQLDLQTREQIMTVQAARTHLKKCRLGG